ncbi:MAG: homoserine O-succinyltransferase [Robiginitomaculum sp.]|nr:homoserine O-succinyltransferase [Robiginitomaculum sp.]
MAYDVEICLGDHVLERGDTLENDMVQGRLYGKAGAPVIVIPGGISASRFIADERPSGAQTGDNWWSELVYAGGPIDLNYYQVLGLDLAPCGANAKRHLTITTHDQARRLSALLTYLNIDKVHTIIGTSYGGMVALAFAALYPDKLEKMCVLGASHRPFPMGVGVRGIQRRIIEFACECGRPEDGLKLARQLAMTTYRSAEEFSGRFDAEPIEGNPNGFDVGNYLQACGEKYPDAMPVERFMALSQSIDLHRIDPAKITTPTLLIATNSDQLAPPSEIKALHRALAGPSEMVVIESIFGHDSFLKECEILGPLLANSISRVCRAA